MATSRDPEVEQLLSSLRSIHAAELARSRARSERLRRQLGNDIVVLDANGALCSATGTAIDRINRYFKGARRPPSYLPEDLVRWLRLETYRRVDEPLRASRPLTLEGADGTLTVRSVYDPPETLLVVEERPLALESLVARLPLSPREKQILVRAGLGATNAAIARALDLSPATVKKHLEHIYQKLGVSGRVAAITRALGTRIANVLALTYVSDLFSTDLSEALGALLP